MAIKIKSVSCCPKIVTVMVVAMLLVQITFVEGGKLMDKSKKIASKENRCPEGKDGALCRKSSRQEPSVMGGAETISSNYGEVAVQSNTRRQSFAKRFEHCMQFAERTVVQLSRELLSFYGFERNGWEIEIIELILKTLAKDMVFIIQAMQF